MYTKKIYKKNIIFLLFLGVFIQQCNTASKKNSSSLSNSSFDTQRLDQLKSEMVLGRNMAGHLLQFYGMVKEEDVIKYINKIGLHVAKYSDFPNRLYHFGVLNTKEIVSFACPGGYIMISMGAIQLAESEAEIAAILAHEIAHVGKKHMFNKLVQMKEEELNLLNTKTKKNFLKAMKIRTRIQTKDSSLFATYIAKFHVGAKNLGIRLMKSTIAGVGLILEKGLDHQYELEADILGTKFLRQAIYNPRALYTFLNRMEKTSNHSSTKIINTTHPSWGKRKSNLKKLFDSSEKEELIGADQVKRFNKFKNKLKKT